MSEMLLFLTGGYVSLTFVNTFICTIFYDYPLIICKTFDSLFVTGAETIIKSSSWHKFHQTQY